MASTPIRPGDDACSSATHSCEGSFTSSSSMTPSRAFFTRGVSVLIFMPGPAGMAHDATGLGLFSTCNEQHPK